MRVGILLALVLESGLAGCAAPGGPLADAAPLGTLSFGADGLSTPIALAGESAAVWAVGDPDVCFSLEHAARGAALDIVDSAGLRYQRLRCETGTPLRAPLADALDVSWVPVARPREGRVAIRFIITEHSALRGEPAAQQALVQALATELSSVGLAPELSEAVEVTGAPAESRFRDLAPDALDELLALAPPALAGTVDVVFAGCLRRVDPLGAPSAVLGFTGRVGGGGGGAADAVFLPGLICDSFDRMPAPADAEATAHVLAHELGHFLGLAHVDDEANAMHPNPRLATANGFTDTQVAHMHSHPFVRPRSR